MEMLVLSQLVAKFFVFVLVVYFCSLMQYGLKFERESISILGETIALLHKSWNSNYCGQRI